MHELQDIVHPATLAQIGVYQTLGLRARTLTLPVMVGLVISLIWRQMGGVSELARVINQECVLWVPKMKVSMQALNARFRAMPAVLFEKVMLEALPAFNARWHERKRQLTTSMSWVKERYTQVLICDGSTLETVVRKAGLLTECEKNPLAGRMMGLLDAITRLPVWIGYTDDESANDQRFWDGILERVKSGALLVFDMGFTNFARWEEMTHKGIKFITRAKTAMPYTLAQELSVSAELHDLLVWIGRESHKTRLQIRLIRVMYQGKWYEYLSNEFSADRLPAEVLVDVYRQRWRIEDAFLTTKTLLGLSYFVCGAQNAIALQVWATWLLYATLVDLVDTVADALATPIADISMEMVYRALPFYVKAKHRNEANDLIAFLVTHHKLFGLIKRKRPKTPAYRRLQTPLTDGQLS